jgi:two-component system OmpR family response regulator
MRGEVNMRVLVVEDDSKISSYLQKGLSQVGYVADVAEDAETAQQYLHTHDYAAVIVDLILPGISGEQLIRELRNQEMQTPILILSAKQSVDERVEGLRSGADDYITKPFSFTELVERIRAAQRRMQESSWSAPTLSTGTLTLDVSARRAYRNGAPIELKPKELSLLEILLRNKGNVVPKAVLLEKIWGLDFDPQTNVLDVLVHRLRKKLDEPFDQPVIETVRGVGYAIHDGTDA